MPLFSLFFARSRWALVLASLAGAVSGLASSAIIALINRVLRQAGYWSGRTIVVLAGLCALRLVSGLLSQMLLIRLAQDAIRDMRVTLCQRILSSPLHHIENLGQHRLLAAFTDDMLNVANVVINIPYAIVNVAILAGCLIYLGWLSGVVLIGILGCMTLGVVSYLLPVISANRRLRVARKKQDTLFAHFRALMEGLKELKLHAPRQQDFMRHLCISAEEVGSEKSAGVSIYATAANWNRLLFFVYAGVVLFAFPSVFRSGGIATTAAYIVVILYMMAPLEAILNVLPHLAVANTALRQVESLNMDLQSRTEGVGNSEFQDVPLDWKMLKLSQVCYTYRDPDGSIAFSLGPINCRFERGEIVFLVGANGSGKSTLAKILTGLYLPCSGTVHVDSIPVNAASLFSYRQLFSAIFAEFHVFDRLFGLQSFELDRDARDWLAKLRLDHKVQVRGGRFTTVALSAGQRKRLALLTAILEDRSFYVFDEWAADQDAQFKEVFYVQILPELKRRGKTVLVITQDDRYFHVADRILRMDEWTVQAAQHPANPIPHVAYVDSGS